MTGRGRADLFCRCCSGGTIGTGCAKCLLLVSANERKCRSRADLFSLPFSAFSIFNPSILIHSPLLFLYSVRRLFLGTGRCVSPPWDYFHAAELNLPPLFQLPFDRWTCFPPSRLLNHRRPRLLGHALPRRCVAPLFPHHFKVHTLSSPRRNGYRMASSRLLHHLLCPLRRRSVRFQHRLEVRHLSPLSTVSRAEMLTSPPSHGSYVVNDAVSTASDLTAAQVILEYWHAQHAWAVSLAFLVFVVGINLTHVRAYGEVRLPLSSLVPPFAADLSSIAARVLAVVAQDHRHRYFLLPRYRWCASLPPLPIPHQWR